MSKAYFICGADTDIGKTFVSCGLLQNLPNAQMIKVIQTGETLIDQSHYLNVNPKAKIHTLLHFKLPSSPHLAAQKENQVIDLNNLTSTILDAINTSEITLIEGSGGIMTPINHQASFIDLIASLNLPVILVIKNTLGAINQALLSIEALESRQISIQAILFNEVTAISNSEEHLIREENVHFIQQKYPQYDVINITHVSNLTMPINSIAPQLQELCKKLIQPEMPMSSYEEDLLFDKTHLWHPYEKLSSNTERAIVKKTEGVYITLHDGRTILDGMSSWWSSINGYHHPELIKAITNQANQLPHIMFGGLTHEPAIQLGKKILSLVPSNLTQLFYSDSGSVAVEISLKMAQQYWQGLNQPNKSKFISFQGGYHGDTYGAMSVTDPVGGMHTLFKDSIIQHIFAPKPNAPFDQPFDEKALTNLEEIIKRDHKDCAAVIIEPILQGAGGMRLYHPDYLKGIKTLCERYDLLLIIDEIATGFGRTGKLFASEWAKIQPDIMCIGKALTGGMLTLAATLCSQAVSDGISAKGLPFMHGPTYMANPIACQVAIKNLELLEQSNWQEKVKKIEDTLKIGLEPCLSFEHVIDVRVLGAMGVVELNESIQTKSLIPYFLKHNAWIKPFGNIIYLMPSFIIKDEELIILTNLIQNAIRKQVWIEGSI